VLTADRQRISAAIKAEVDPEVRDGHSGGLRHLASTLVTITDMTTWNGVA
jgi:hypothetical protein